MLSAALNSLGLKNLLLKTVNRISVVGHRNTSDGKVTGTVIDVDEVKQAFEQFKNDNGVVYVSAKEEAQRFKIFAEEFAEVKAHNDRAAKGLESFTVGINQFSDLTFDEFGAKYCMSSKFGPKAHKNE